MSSWHLFGNSTNGTENSWFSAKAASYILQAHCFLFSVPCSCFSYWMSTMCSAWFSVKNWMILYLKNLSQMRLFAFNLIWCILSVSFFILQNNRSKGFHSFSQWAKMCPVFIHHLFLMVFVCIFCLFVLKCELLFLSRCSSSSTRHGFLEE